MNWKECPWIFANGKFKVKWYFEGKPEGVYDILGFATDEGHAFMVEGTDGSKFDYIFPQSEQMELIARPIEDMTDEEIREAGKTCEFRDMGRLKLRYMDAWQFTYLLSIGCYPFSEDEDVIFKPKP